MGTSWIMNAGWRVSDMMLLAQQGGAAPAANDMRPMIFMFVAIGVLFYFILLRPQRQEQKKHQEMLNSVRKGDRVVTIGGMHGTVESVDAGKSVVFVQIAPKITVKLNKSALASVTPKGGKDDESAETESKPEESEAKKKS